MTKAKKMTLLFTGLLFCWFLLDITGLTLGNTIIVVSAFIDEPIDIAFLVIYGILIYLFVRHEKIGKWLVSVYLLVWSITQGSQYFSNDFTGYYRFFADEGTHRILPENSAFLVKDTYHIILDTLILAAFIGSIIFLIQQLRNARMTSDQ
jgi:hypothetical protein